MNPGKQCSNARKARLERAWRRIDYFQKLYLLFLVFAYTVWFDAYCWVTDLRRGLFRDQIVNFIVRLYPAHWVTVEKLEKKKYGI